MIEEFVLECVEYADSVIPSGLKALFSDDKVSVLGWINSDPALLEFFDYMFAEYCPIVGGEIDTETFDEILNNSGLTLTDLKILSGLVAVLEKNAAPGQFAKALPLVAGLSRHAARLGILSEIYNAAKNIDGQTIKYKVGTSISDSRTAGLYDIIGQICGVMAIADLKGRLDNAGIDPKRIAAVLPRLTDVLNLTNRIVSGELKFAYAPESGVPYFDWENTTIIIEKMPGNADDFFENADDMQRGGAPAQNLIHELAHASRYKETGLSAHHLDWESEAYVITMVYNILVFGDVVDKTFKDISYKKDDTQIHAKQNFIKIFGEDSFDSLIEIYLREQGNPHYRAERWARTFLNFLGSPADHFNANLSGWKNEMLPKLSANSLISYQENPQGLSPYADDLNVAAAYATKLAIGEVFALMVDDANISPAIANSLAKKHNDVRVPADIFTKNTRDIELSPTNTDDLKKYLLSFKKSLLEFRTGLARQGMPVPDAFESSYTDFVMIGQIWCSYVAMLPNRKSEARSFYYDEILSTMIRVNALRKFPKDRL